MKTQLHCGFVISTVNHFLSKLDKKVFSLNHLERLCTFEVEYNFPLKPIEDSIIAVGDNLLSRGLPTLPSVLIEDIISSLSNFSDKEPNTKTGEIKYEARSNQPELFDLILRSFFIVDPRIKSDQLIANDFLSSKENPPSQFEATFFSEILPNLFHQSLCQIIEPQRSIESILGINSEYENVHSPSSIPPSKDFHNQRTDFCFDIPEYDLYNHGLVIEIDGSQHNQEAQNILDKKRDDALEVKGWSRTIRIKTKDINSIPEYQVRSINNFIKHPYISEIKENYSNPIWCEESGLNALQISLSPMAIARIEKTILFLIKNGQLNLESEVWDIAIIERDVPCGYIAIQDLTDILNNLFVLESEGRKFPKINLSVFQTQEFQSCLLNQDKEVKPIEQFDTLKKYDAILDVAVLQHSGFDFPIILPVSSSNQYIKIRSSHSIKSHRTINCSKPLKFSIPEEEQPEALVYFLNNIFRKVKFLEKQVAILRKMLALESVIALLPTGAGKSLTYQLSALLQPGIVMVVDPLKSLMLDQDQNLRAAGIDSTAFINSSLTVSERKIRSQKLKDGQYQFVFITPERLQIQEFRTILAEMKGIHFTYCVIDEAHCVSEWGHDFRTAYLRLGQNARKYCKTKAPKLPLIGLTGTASYDVLADVQRELFIDDELAIIAPDKYQRDELKFKIEKLSLENIHGKATDFQTQEKVAEEKKLKLFEIINSLASQPWSNKQKYDSIDQFFSRDNEYKNSGIIFCPHVRWIFGVNDIADRIKSEFTSLDALTNVYAGSLNDNDLINLEEVQRDFKSDILGLLVATKAFGMGIDKPNIRFTIHFSMPQSIESFYQEVGRAGRDKEDAYCYILYSPAELTEHRDKPVSVDKSLMLSFFHNSFPGPEKEKRIMWELLDHIIYPSDNLDQKVDSLKDIFNQPIKLNLWSKNINRLYVNSPEFPKTFGYIDLSTGFVSPEKDKDKEVLVESEANIFLNIILAELKDRCPRDKSLKRWLTSEEKQDPQPGFEQMISNLPYNKSVTVILPLRNDRIQKITKCLQDVNSKWDESMVKKDNEYCHNPEKFIEKIILTNKKLPNSPKNISLAIENEVRGFFEEIREDQETFRAIYRLSIVGLVKDYTVDYNSKTITAELIKREDSEYVKKLAEYIGCFGTPEKMNQVEQEILSTRGDSVLQKCCGYLIDFVYSKIASKREKAIDVMEQAIIEENNFDDIVNSYFDSKFTPTFRDYIYQDTIHWVWRFFDDDDNKTLDQDSISHLRGACDRLLVENPNNPGLLLLSSYAKLATSTDDKTDALNDFHNGWRILRENNILSRKEYLFSLSKFYELITSYDSSVHKYLDNELIKIHSAWLRSFNKTFLEEVENV